MSATLSTMLPLGTVMPEFTLPDVATDGLVSSAEFAKDEALVITFLCAHCPYVLHVKEELARLGRDYGTRGVGFVGITSNDVATHPQDAPEPTAAFARAAGFTFPILYDESQQVAQAFTAACTPDFFVFGPDRTLVYRGQLDSSRPGKAEANGEDLRAALDATLARQPVPAAQRPSIGCNIKWKPGNQPQ